MNPLGGKRTADSLSLQELPSNKAAKTNEGSKLTGIFQEVKKEEVKSGKPNPISAEVSDPSDPQAKKISETSQQGTNGFVGTFQTPESSLTKQQEISHHEQRIKENIQQNAPEKKGAAMLARFKKANQAAAPESKAVEEQAATPPKTEEAGKLPEGKPVSEETQKQELPKKGAAMLARFKKANQENAAPSQPKEPTKESPLESHPEPAKNQESPTEPESQSEGMEIVPHHPESVIKSESSLQAQKSETANIRPDVLKRIESTEKSTLHNFLFLLLEKNGNLQQCNMQESNIIVDAASKQIFIKQEINKILHSHPQNLRTFLGDDADKFNITELNNDEWSLFMNHLSNLANKTVSKQDKNTDKNTEDTFTSGLALSPKTKKTTNENSENEKQTSSFSYLSSSKATEEASQQAKNTEKRIDEHSKAKDEAAQDKKLRNLHQDIEKRRISIEKSHKEMNS